jgi:hypothetical protein
MCLTDPLEGRHVCGEFVQWEVFVFIVLVYALVDMNLMRFDMNVKHGSMEDGRTLFSKVPT